MSITVVAGGMTRVDGLCSSCLLPSLWVTPLHLLTARGAGVIGWHYVCDGCGAVTPPARTGASDD